MLLSSSSLFIVRRLNVRRCGSSSSSIANNSHVRWVGSTTAITKHHPILGATTITTVTSMARTTACTQRTIRTQRGCSMSTQPLATEEEDVAQIMLILGKPGGGKGTISGKLLKVCFTLVPFIHVYLIYIYTNNMLLPQMLSHPC
jgi:hypothetical protein